MQRENGEDSRPLRQWIVNNGSSSSPFSSLSSVYPFKGDYHYLWKPRDTDKDFIQHLMETGQGQVGNMWTQWRRNAAIARKSRAAIMAGSTLSGRQTWGGRERSI